MTQSGGIKQHKRQDHCYSNWHGMVEYVPKTDLLFKSCCKLNPPVDPPLFCLFSVGVPSAGCSTASWSACLTLVTSELSSDVAH